MRLQLSLAGQKKELKDHGKDLASRAVKDAEVLNDVKA